MTHVYLAYLETSVNARPLGTFRTLERAVQECLSAHANYPPPSKAFCTVEKIELDAVGSPAWGERVWQTGQPVPEAGS